ncbi:MAG: hypothetical protein AAB322_06505, partial [Pseudomonadota bacterium]
GAADQQRQRKARMFHFFGDMHHFIQRRRNQAAQTDHIDIQTLGFGENAVGGNQIFDQFWRFASDVIEQCRALAGLGLILVRAQGETN